MKRIKAIIVTVIIAISAVCTACGYAPTEQLEAPKNLRVQGGMLVWDKVENAIGYIVYAENKEYIVSESSYELTELSEPNTYKIEVMAMGDGITCDDSAWTTFIYTVTPPAPIMPTENLAYILLPDGRGYEVSRGKADLNGRIVIPDEYNGLPVKKIADRAFDVSGLNADPYTGKGCNTKTTEFRLPERLEEIGENAFAYCTALTEINIPDTVKNIGANVFGRDIKLAKVKLPSTLAYISMGMFLYCDSLTSIEIPQTVSEIGLSAFRGCKSLKGIELPENLQKLDHCAFKGCSSLTKIVIPNGINRFQDEIFEDCTALADINFPSELEYIGMNSVTGTAWFNNRPDGFVTIYDWLVGYKGDLPNGGIIERFPSGIKHIAGGVFEKSELLSIVLPEGVDIGAYIFDQCKFLTDVQLSDDLKAIPSFAFRDCVKLKSIVIPNSVTLIGSSAFYRCKSLIDVSIPSSVTRINNDAFFACSSLSNIIIPNSVTEIGNNAFHSCKNLTHLYYAGTEQEWKDKGLFKAGVDESGIYYYAETLNDVPAGGGNYWHYDTDGQTPVVWANE